MRRSKEEVMNDYATQLKMEKKICSVCGEWKGIENYYKMETTYDGLYPQCKKCHYGKQKRLGKVYPPKRPKWAIDLENEIKGVTIA